MIKNTKNKLVNGEEVFIIEAENNTMSQNGVMMKEACGVFTMKENS